MTNQYHISRVCTSSDLKKSKQFINTYHSYIVYSDRPSRKLYWNLYENDIMVGVFALSSAFTFSNKIKDVMMNNNITFNEVANNIVYCLANYIGCNVGTIFLALCRKDAIKWWYEKYDDRLKMFQSFILPPRSGSMYKADNWVELGMTTGNSIKTTTIPNKDVGKYNHVQEQIIKGRKRYLIRSTNTVCPKIIFIKINSDKKITKLISSTEDAVKLLF